MSYKVIPSLKAGVNSSFVISDGLKTSVIAFESKTEAQSHIDRRLAIGQDPMSLTIDYDTMGKFLLNS